MQKTQIIYKGRKPDISEVLELMPHLEIRLKRFLPEDIKTVYNPYYKITTIDWDWFRTLFDVGNDVDAFVLEKTDLKGIGVTGHWGLYSIDGDTDHQFYMTDLGDKLDKRAKANGFRTNFAWMFCHEYLHGAVWGNTRNAQLAAQLVHDWEAQGVLKEKIKEDVEEYIKKQKTVSLLQQVVDLYKKLIAKKQYNLLPRVERGADAIISEMKRRGHEVRIVQGYRSKEEQDRLYAQGRTTPGAIVTNARGGESLHNYGCAVDFVFVKEGYNASSLLWELLGSVGKNQGFEWGGDWTRLVDKPHFEMTLGYSLKDFQEGKVDYSKFN